ncbi:MAG: acVLRF1 family peptidyl-tRNA hydrolase [Angustibacter sp.]
MGPRQDHRRRPRAAARAGLQPLTGPGSSPRRVEVAPERVQRWIDGFVERHGAAQAAVVEGAVHLLAADGSTAVLSPLLPLGGDVDAPHAVETLVRRAEVPPSPLVVVLVRRGGYAVGVVRDGRLAASKVGSRYVQSRTAAGGWSQQRFARRRDNQAAALLDAVGDVVVRLALGDDGHSVEPGTCLVTGGDRTLVDQLLAQPRLSGLAAVRCTRHLDVPDPRADVLRDAVTRALAVEVHVTNA